MLFSEDAKICNKIGIFQGKPYPAGGRKHPRPRAFSTESTLSWKKICKNSRAIYDFEKSTLISYGHFGDFMTLVGLPLFSI